MTSMEEKFNQLKAIVALAEDDLKKFADKGNKTAGTRLRKSMQDVKAIASEIRKEVLEARK